MHFPYQTGGIAVFCKVAGLGSMFREDDPVIGPGGTAVHLFAGEHAHTRGSAERRSAQRRIELNRAACQPVQVGRIHIGIAGKTGNTCHVLICHDEYSDGTAASATSLRVVHYGHLPLSAVSIENAARQPTRSKYST